MKSSFTGALRSLLVLALLGALSQSGSAQIISNGDFESGLAGWTVVNPGSAASGVDFFDIDGPRTQTDSSVFFAQPGTAGRNSGQVNLQQTVQLEAGMVYAFSADIAATNLNSIQASVRSGQLTVSLGGSSLTSFDFGNILPRQNKFGTVSGLFTPSASGNYLLDIGFARSFPANAATPMQRIDNLMLTARPSAVPEPGAMLLLLGAALPIAAHCLRRQTRRITRS